MKILKTQHTIIICFILLSGRETFPALASSKGSCNTMTREDYTESTSTITQRVLVRLKALPQQPETIDLPNPLISTLPRYTRTLGGVSLEASHSSTENPKPILKKEVVTHKKSIKKEKKLKRGH